ncbi:hypothetical protein LTR05_005981 [Lithohypha guttulata]|uniref:Argonaute linker 1 domain-containing protein n=1 Tax=Lithohypha guttulata TaxID=1690604 RepID=A0AAN7YEL5_9EURO|nr:hypothetical protein LTR05_005981 [Lithohypha guttulata]
MSGPKSPATSIPASPVHSERGASPSAHSPRSARLDTLPNIASMTTKDPNAHQLALRPGYGNVGKRTKARANFIRLDLSHFQDMVAYSAEHKEKKTGRGARGRVVTRADSLLFQNFQKVNSTRFDNAASNYGNRFYSRQAHPLVQPGKQVYTYVVDYYEVEESGPRQGDRQYEISVILQIDGNFIAAPLQAYINNPNNFNFPRILDYVAMFNTLLDRAVSENTALANHARRTKFFNITSNNGRAALSAGLEAYRGYFKSVRDCIDGLFLNINTSACAMFQQGRLDMIIKELGSDTRSLGAVLKGCRVSTG